MFNKIFELAKEKKITKKELADFLSINVKTLYDWNEGRTSPSIKTLIKLSEYFDVSIDYLLEQSPSRNASRDLKKCFGENEVTSETISEIQKIAKILKISELLKDVPIDEINVDNIKSQNRTG